MAEHGSYVVEVEVGSADPPSIALGVGTTVAPMAVGRRGVWRIQATDVLDVHGFLHFDGRSFFLRSADDQRPIVADGRAVGKTWTRVSAPCTITAGDARLRFRDAAANEVAVDASTLAARTSVKDVPAVPLPAAITFSDEPVSSSRMQMPPVPFEAAEPMVRIPPPPYLPGQVPLRKSIASKGVWKRLTLPEKLLVFLSPLLMLAIYFLLRGGL